MKKLFSLVLLAGVSSLFAHNPSFDKPLLGKLIDSVGKSETMDWFNRSVMQKMVRLSHEKSECDDIPVSVGLQQLGKEAQDVLEIPIEHQLSLKKIAPTSITYQYAGGVAHADAIYVNEEKLNARTFGLRRRVLFHEAVHVKYHDQSVAQVLEFIAFSATAVLAYKAIKSIRPQGNKWLRLLGVVATSSIIEGILSSKYQQYMERRADIEGHYATQCHVCVQESAMQRREEFEVKNNPLRYNGYLWANDLEKIATDLKVQNKICCFHAKESGLLTNKAVAS